jgi:hypothetical protein
MELSYSSEGVYELDLGLGGGSKWSSGLGVDPMKTPSSL